MKKLLIGLLVIAAGAGAYFYCNSKKGDKPSSQELIVGKWKNVQLVIDTVLPNYNYDFQKEGVAFRSVSDTVKADTIRYEWNKTGELLIKEKATDSTAKVYIVAKLTADTLQLQTVDKVSTSTFIKTK
jgi:hypothetical protein